MPDTEGMARHGGVAIVGLGAACPAGRGVSALWKALFEPPSPPTADALADLPADGRSWRHAHAFQGAAPNPADKRASHFESLALQALTEACVDAQLDAPVWQGACIGLAIGTAAGDTALAETARRDGQAAAFETCNPYAVTDRLSDLLGMPIEGPVFTVSNACAAALYALSQSVDLILDGTVDAMLVVGVEVLSMVTQAGFHRMTALDPDRCRPFDLHRQGTVLGEGAGALLLVSRDLALRLGREPYCYVAGHGTSCDAHHPTAPQPEGRDIRAAVKDALRDAGLSPSAPRITMVVPHGTGTQLNDRIEGELLRELFGEAVSAVHLLPIKAHLGHCAGASGALSAVVAAKALATGQVPPTLHIDQPDEALAVRFSREPAALATGHDSRALVNAYGFGGNNVSVILEAAHHG